MERRRFLARAATVAAAPALLASTPPAPGALIDTNVSLGEWPTRRSWAGTPAQLASRLRQHGVTAAWAGTFDAVLHTDVAGINAQLSAACAREGDGRFFLPFGTINPLLPDWEDDLRRCHEVLHLPGLRLYPNYHGYSLDDRRFATLLAGAARRGLFVQISLSMEDDRSQNPVFTASPVNAAPLLDLLPKVPGARVMLLNCSSRVLGPGNPLLAKLAKAGVWFETATLEGVAGISSLLDKLPDLRLAFGSHAPYYYFEAALLKLQESPLTPAQLAAVRHGHARAALASA
ncbi:MAG: amidohydrolase family protein [Verrucomicrobia bacterium]|nr:amidohydrolase family protein [Verrucomicrobiota bacterium]